MVEARLTVVKVGGSLFGWSDFRGRLGQWLEGHRAAPLLLVPGGGPTADVVRSLDRLHHLGQEDAHWLALRAMSVNAWFLRCLVPGSVVIDEPSHGQPGAIGIIDGHAFADADEGRPGCLPHSWDVTSDSRDVPPGCPWDEAARQGWVDGHFPRVVAAAPGLAVEAVNLRRGPGP
jgi:aspartokinase-like uncharacterized kinase